MVSTGYEYKCGEEREPSVPYCLFLFDPVIGFIVQRSGVLILPAHVWWQK